MHWPWGQKVNGQGHSVMKCSNVWRRGYTCQYDYLGFWSRPMSNDWWWWGDRCGFKTVAPSGDARRRRTSWLQRLKPESPSHRHNSSLTSITTSSSAIILAVPACFTASVLRCRPTLGTWSLAAVPVIWTVPPPRRQCWRRSTSVISSRPRRHPVSSASSSATRRPPTINSSQRRSWQSRLPTPKHQPGWPLTCKILINPMRKYRSSGVLTPSYGGLG